jgi:transcriptional regulator with XRE-family HTH domain
MATNRKRTPAGVGRVVGRQVKEARRIANVSQGELVRRLREQGVRLNQTAVARLEAGQRRISVDELFAIAAVLGVAPLYLLSGSLTSDTVPVTPKIEAGPMQMYFWIKGEVAPPWTDERSFLEIVPDHERLARMRRGLLNLRQCVQDFAEAAGANEGRGDRVGMTNALQDLVREIGRQQDELDREDRRAQRTLEPKEDTDA